MKKVFFHIGTVILALSLASCAEKPAVPDGVGEMTFMARIADEEVDSKASLSGTDSEGYQVLWSEGDQIHILVRGETQEAFTYTLIQGAGTKFGAFAGPALPDGEHMAGYGDNLNVINSGSLGPDQVYTPGKEACCAPMMATVTVTNGVANISDFKNICGLMRLELTGKGTVKQIKVTTDQAQVGLIKLDEEGAAYISSYPPGKIVSLDCGENGVELSLDPKSFYISMPKNDYTGVKLELTNMEGYTLTRTLKTDKALNIARAQITPVSLTAMLVPTTGTMSNKDGKLITWVQLWEDGPKWATCNVCDSEENEYFESVRSCGIDYATELWGENWRTPTLDEAFALNGNTYTSWNDYENAGIVSGQDLYSGNRITLPARGYVDKDGHTRDIWTACYWVTFEAGNSNYIKMNEEFPFSIGHAARNDKLPIRPVVNE